MSIGKRGFRYVKKTTQRSTNDDHNLLRSRSDHFQHVLVEDVVHTGVQLVIKAGTCVTVESVVPCANGVWFKTIQAGTPVWFLGDGRDRSYKTIYREIEEE